MLMDQEEERKGQELISFSYRRRIKDLLLAPRKRNTAARLSSCATPFFLSFDWTGHNI